MKQTAKGVVITVISVVLMCLATVLAVLYTEGYYDISFIHRPHRETDRVTEGTTAEDTLHTEETEPDKGTEQTQQETETEYVAEETEFDHLSAVPQGYEICCEDYDGEKQVLVKLPLLDTVSMDEYHTYSRPFYNKTVSDGKRVYTRTLSEVKAPSVFAYMGMLVYPREDGLLFTDIYGNTLYKHVWEYDEVVISGTGEGTEAQDTTVKLKIPLVLAYERDENGHPMLIYKDERYVISEGALVPAEYREIYFRGLCYDYPVEFGMYPGQYETFCSGGKYGVLDSEGKRVRSAIYEMGYNFSEGLGMVIYEGEMYYLSEDMEVAVDSGYLPVADLDEGGIGGLYFEYGHVRVRKVSFYQGAIREDVDVIIDSTGKEFDLPDGHELIALSCGRILVRDISSGKYGFYSLKGAWITDTVYNYASPYYEGLAAVEKNGRYGLIDMDGNYVIPPVYDSISAPSSGVIICRSGSDWEMYVKYCPAEPEASPEG